MYRLRRLDTSEKTRHAGLANIKTGESVTLTPEAPPNHAAHANGVDVCLIDTAPSATRAAREAAQAAHHLLIPCRPALFNLASMGSSLNMAHTLLKKTVCGILSRKAPMPLKPL